MLQTQAWSVHSFLVRSNAGSFCYLSPQHMQRQHSPASLTIRLKHMTSFWPTNLSKSDKSLLGQQGRKAEVVFCLSYCIFGSFMPMAELETETAGNSGLFLKEVLGEMVSPLAKEEFVLFYFLFITNHWDFKFLLRYLILSTLFISWSLQAGYHNRYCSHSYYCNHRQSYSSTFDICISVYFVSLSLLEPFKLDPMNHWYLWAVQCWLITSMFHIPWILSFLLLNALPPSISAWLPLLSSCLLSPHRFNEGYSDYPWHCNLHLPTHFKSVLLYSVFT